MKSSKGKDRPKRPEAPRVPGRLRWGALVLAALVIAGVLLWFLTRDDPDVLAARGKSLLERDSGQAIALLERAVAAAGNDHPQAQVLLCEAYAREARWLEALGCLSLIQRKADCDSERLLALAHEALLAGEPIFAQNVLAVAQEAGATEDKVLRLEIPMRLDLRQDSAALDAHYRLAQVAPEAPYPFPRAIEARVLRNRGDVLAAIDAYQAALGEAQSQAELNLLRRDLLDLLVLKKDAAEARRQLEQLLPELSARGESPLLRAQVLRIEGRFEEALEQVETFLSHEANDARGLLLRGTVLFDLERFEAAAADLRRVVELNPRQKEAHYKLGQSLLRLARQEEGNKHLEISARLTAQTVEILNLERESAKDPQNESLRARLRELYKAVGISPGQP
jgi:tetratricopeptide (TPR) repeat protein